MTPQLRTALFLALFVLTAIVADVYFYFASGVEATISAVVLAGSRTWPALAFAVGFLCGHLFWPQKGAS